MSRTAEIAGGGIAGLSLAWALADRGWRVRLHERGEEIREVGAGIYLMRNSTSIFAHHGLEDRILQDSVTLTGSERVTRDGTLIQRTRFTPETEWVVLPRPDLIRRLADIAREAGAEIVTQSRIAGIDPSGALIGEDGQRFEADLVVAADGVRSALRGKLGLDMLYEDRSSGATRILVPRDKNRDRPVMQEYWSGRRRIGIAPCGPDQMYAYLSCPNDDLAAQVPLDVKIWTEAFPGCDWFFERVTDPDAAVRHGYSLARARHWHTGAAAVIGDAAHGLPPTLAQGAGLSITNAYALAATLEREPDIPTALAAWEAQQRWISDRTQDWSRRLDQITTGWPAPLMPLRRPALWAIGAVFGGRVRVADRVRLAS